MCELRPAMNAHAARLLPTDIVLSILDHVPRRTVIAVAGVSRHWRLIAICHPEFFRRIYVDGSPTGLEKLRNLDTILEQTRKTPLRAALEVYLPAATDVTAIGAGQLLAIQRALTDLLVYLNVFVDYFLADVVLDYLCVPAPLLRDFAFQSTQPPESDSLPQISHSLFSGRAPSLRSVLLERAAIDTTSAVPAFVSITKASLSQTFKSNARLDHILPEIRVLSIYALPSSAAAPQPVLLDFQNTVLRILTVWQLEGSHILALDNLPPHIHRLALQGVHDVDPTGIWGTLQSPLSLEVGFRHFFDVATTIWARSESQLHAAQLTDLPDPLAMLHLTALRSRLDDVTSLSVCNARVLSVLSAWAGAVLPALTKLTIILVRNEPSIFPSMTEEQRHKLWTSDAQPATPTVHCTALSEIIVSRDSSTHVRAAELVRLARGFGLGSRRCVLVLLDLELEYDDDDDGENLELLDSVFSSVRKESVVKI